MHTINTGEEKTNSNLNFDHFLQCKKTAAPRGGFKTKQQLQVCLVGLNGLYQFYSYPLSKKKKSDASFKVKALVDPPSRFVRGLLQE